ncbi:DEAD/DEAH box helicase [Fibrella sp. HMF5335]|uniref:DEAD/DEAH box helicase n=1 Tax=Fibrella rubiginis TaxID=2817060 RepID=A0A939GG18_9BACT|nr:DEAD/DEAH box helicase [Fibrella rubiginis]MBO0938329.1 DEAD/DEAH box helicase [Fibrella rubiginis]
MSFSTLGLSESLQRGVAQQGYADPYPIQDQAIPPILAGRDVLGIARTGSGKTASFVLPILEKLQEFTVTKKQPVRVLVVVPTRELAAQVAEVFQTFGDFVMRGVKTVAVFGGVPIAPQLAAVRGADVLVATPGRLLDLVAQKALKLSSVSILVLDEADKILDLGFADEMKQVFELLPTVRQTILFSATLGDGVKAMGNNALRDPLSIEVPEEPLDIEQIKQTAYRTTLERKGVLLRYLIKTGKLKQVLVFVSSTRTADNVVAKLVKNGIQAAAMHGDKSQAARTETLNKFKAGKLTVMVATDLISRGIDIQFLPHVINFELPRSPKDYVHRIGRTGRAAASGEAISLITPDDEHHFKIIQKKMGKRVDIIDTADLALTGY